MCGVCVCVCGGSEGDESSDNVDPVESWDVGFSVCGVCVCECVGQL